MKRCLFIILILMHTACGETPQGANQHRQVVAEAGFADTDEVYQGEYKRYTGTIAGQPVVLNMTRCDLNIQARYYKESTGEFVSLYRGDDTTTPENELRLMENTPEGAKWHIRLFADSISGDWMTGDVIRPVRLKESYREDIQRFSIISVADSIPFTDSLPEPKAVLKYQVLLPAGKDEGARFIKSVILKNIGCDTTAGSMNNCLKNIKQDYFTRYRTTQGELPENMTASFNSWELNIGYAVVYNEHDMVVLDNNLYEYTGGAHGNYSSHYLNIDRKNKKILALGDIMNVDTAQTLSLLAEQARLRFGIEQGQALNARLLADELYIPDNFYICSKGITFSYGLYEIASYADGIVELFIPYNKIMDQLTPQFKKRMNLDVIVAK